MGNYGGGHYIYFGCKNKDIMMMIVGRLIYGLGTDCAGLAKHIMIIKWFNKNDLSTPFGIALSVSRIGTIVNDILSPKIANVKLFFNVLSFFIGRNKSFLSHLDRINNNDSWVNFQYYFNHNRLYCRQLL